VLVKGELRTSKYTDDDGVTRETVEVVAETLLRIDYSKVAIAERGDAYEPDEAA
jgi:single-stranded DNA-binding protein